MVIGAGPVGLLAALLLARRGISVTVLEKHNRIIDSPRAIVYLPQTIGTLDEAGILEEVMTAGLVTNDGPVFRNASDHKALAEMNPLVLKPEDKPEPKHRLAILLGQHLLAEIALTKLRSYNVPVHFDATFQSLEQGPSSVKISALVNSETVEFEASYVLACDGARSAVRKQLDIEFEGFTHDIAFMAVNFRYAHILDTGFSNAQFLVDPKEDKSHSDFAIILRTGRGDVWRCAYGDDGSLTEEELKTRMLGRLQRILPLNPSPEEVEVLQAQQYKIHQRAAATFVKGRILLAGDAAHVNNPVGGMGLCTGILDAHAAAVAFEKAIKMEIEEEVAFQKYNTDRREAFLQLTNPATIDNLRRLCEASEEADNLRGKFFTMLNESQDFQRIVQLSMNKMAKGVPGF
jgi:2-polyprenyl-6-methoxyphenol hydroxylase-like FAD-dependent oxidoreductase